MPKLSTLFIRGAMLYLIAGFTIGALMLGNKGLPSYPPLWRLRPLHIEYLLLGWTLQLIMGMAFWILPRWRDQRGDERPAWTAFVLLNLGIVLATAAVLFPLAGSYLLLAGRLAEAASVAAFAIHAWPRVKPLGA